jgi:HEAT repeat protein
MRIGTRIAACIAPLLVASSLVLGCAGNTDPNTPGYWLDRLDDKQSRDEAFKELGKLGDKAAVPAVLEWFEKEGDWQPDAAYTLGQLGDPAVVPKLVAAIDFQVGAGRDHATTRRNRTNQNIARALAMLKAKEGVEPLINLLTTPELKTRESVIRSLGEIGDPRATKALSDIAENEQQPFIRKTAIQALGELGDPNAAPVLVQNLFYELPGTSFYFESRHSLLQIGKAAVPLLIETMQRKNETVESIRLPSRATIADGAVEAKAAFVLGSLRATEAEAQMVDALEKYYGMYKRADGPVFAGVVGAVMELCFALGNMGSKKGVDILEKIAQDEDPNIRVSATEALTVLGSRRSVQPLLKSARSGSAASRRYSIVAISRLGDAGDIDVYNALAKSADKEVSAETLQKMLDAERPRLDAAKECKTDAACWSTKLGDPNTHAKVRERAAYELGWNGDAAHIPALMKAAEDDDNDVRMAAVASLASHEKGLDGKALLAIHDKWKEKIAYKNANAALERLIARLHSVQG